MKRTQSQPHLQKELYPHPQKENSYPVAQRLLSDALPMRILPPHPHALVALEASEHKRTWGPYAAHRYVAKRGCPKRLYFIAVWLRILKYLHQAG